MSAWVEPGVRQGGDDVVAVVAPLHLARVDAVLLVQDGGGGDGGGGGGEEVGRGVAPSHRARPAAEGVVGEVGGGRRVDGSLHAAIQGGRHSPPQRHHYHAAVVDAHRVRVDESAHLGDDSAATATATAIAALLVAVVQLADGAAPQCLAGGCVDAVHVGRLGDRHQHSTAPGRLAVTVHVAGPQPQQRRGGGGGGGGRRRRKTPARATSTAAATAATTDSTTTAHRRH